MSLSLSFSTSTTFLSVFVKSNLSGASLAMQWLNFQAPTAEGCQVWSLAAELRSHMLNSGTEKRKKKFFKQPFLSVFVTSIFVER